VNDDNDTALGGTIPLQDFLWQMRSEETRRSSSRKRFISDELHQINFSRHRLNEDLEIFPIPT